MRILMLTWYFPPETGLASHLFFELAKKLTEKCHKVSVLTGFPRYHVTGDSNLNGKGLLLKENMDGIKVFRVKMPNLPRHIPVVRGFDQFISAFLFFVRGLFIKDFDIVVVYSPPLPLALSGHILSKIRKKPFILNVQDLFPKSVIDLGLLKNGFLIRLMERIEAFLYKKSAVVTVHSGGNRNYVITRGGLPDKVKVIPNWVDIDFIKPGLRENGFREEWKLGDQFVVSFAGIMGYSQDLDIVIESASKLRHHSDIKFWFFRKKVESGF